MKSPVPARVMRRALVAVALAMGTQAAWAQDKPATTLFKVITVKDEIVIGLTSEELGGLA